MERFGVEYQPYESLFRKIFNEKKLTFRLPRSNTCTRCDLFEMKISEFPRVLDEEQFEEKLNLTLEKEEHLIEAEETYMSLSEDKELSLIHI